MTQVQLHTLWLSIRSDAENWLFEIGPQQEQPIVVGTLLRAHVRIDQRGIKPVHVQFERDGNAVRAVPALGAKVYIDGEPATLPRTLAAYATVEFSGLKLETYVFDAEPDGLEHLQLREWARRELQYRSQPETTLTEGNRVHKPEPPRHQAHANSASIPTVAFRPFCDAWLSAPAAILERDLHAPVEASTLPESSLVESQSPTPLERRPTPMDDIPLPVPSRSWFQVAPSAPAAAGTIASARSLARRLRHGSKAALVRLGLLARDKPFVVSLVAVIGATMLMLAMVGIRHCVLLLGGAHLVEQTKTAH